VHSGAHIFVEVSDFFVFYVRGDAMGRWCGVEEEEEEEEEEEKPYYCLILVEKLFKRCCFVLVRRRQSGTMAGCARIRATERERVGGSESRPMIANISGKVSHGAEATMLHSGSYIRRSQCQK
jgi:hypothetical protein